MRGPKEDYLNLRDTDQQPEEYGNKRPWRYPTNPNPPAKPVTQRPGGNCGKESSLAQGKKESH